jgi:hypothetical protein
MPRDIKYKMKRMTYKQQIAYVDKLLDKTVFKLKKIK